MVLLHLPQRFFHFWRRDHNRTNSYRVCMADVPVSIILHDNTRAHTADAVKDLLRHWRGEILQHPPCSPDMSPRDYLFSTMKEPLRGTRYNTREEGTRYNTREEFIRVVRRSLLDINRSGRADGVRRLPQIWQKVVHMR
jgi:transposase